MLQERYTMAAFCLHHRFLTMKQCFGFFFFFCCFFHWLPSAFCHHSLESCHIRNWDTSCLLKRFTVLFSGIDWLQGQDMLFLSFPTPRSHFYSPVDKIRTPCLWLTPVERHPSISSVPLMCVHNRNILVFGSVCSFVVAIVFAHPENSVAYSCPCRPFVVTDSCVWIRWKQNTLKEYYAGF